MQNVKLKIKLLIIISGLLISSALALQFPRHLGFINDYAKVIEAPYLNQLESLAQTLEKETSAELAVVTINSAAPLDTKTYAVELFEAWKLGKKNKDNGILILLAKQEKRVEIEVGYGLEGVITDQFAGQVLDNYVIPRFKDGKFGQGLYTGARVIAGRIAPEKFSPPPESTPYNFGFLIFGIVLLIILMVIITYFKGGKGIWTGTGSGTGPIWRGGNNRSFGGFGGGRSGGAGAGRSW